MPKSTTGKMPFWVMRDGDPVARCSDIGPALHLLAECGTHISIGRVHSSARTVFTSPEWKEWGCVMHDLLEDIEASTAAEIAAIFDLFDARFKRNIGHWRETRRDTAEFNYLKEVLRDKLGLWDVPGWREHGERRPEEVAVP